MFFIFTIPSALLFFLYGLLVIFGMGAIQGVQDFFLFLKDSYWIVVALVIILIIITMIFLTKRKGLLYTFSTFISASHIIFLFLALLYDMIGTADLGDMIATLLIVVPFVGFFMYLSFCAVMSASCGVAEKGKGYYKLYLIAAVGWLITCLLCF